MRFISGEMLGIKRLSTNPETNAPSMPSNPISSQVAALINITASTKIYCITESEYRLRNQRVMWRISHVIAIHHTTNLTKNITQKSVPVSPDILPTNAAVTTRAMRSDSIDAPTESVVTVLRCNP